MIDGGQGVELLSSTISGGLTLPAISVQGATHGLLLKQLSVQTSPAQGVQILGQDHTQARVTQTVIQGSAAAGMLLNTDELLVDNNLIVSNAVGVQLTAGAVTNKLYNNTIADNTGAGLQLDEGASGTLLTNTILAGNGTPIVDEGDGTVATTSLLTAPGFVGGGDYHLASGASPAVDAGTTLTEFTLALDGTVRPQGAAWDIGAYERAGTPAPPGVAAQGAVRPQAAELFFTTR